MLEYPEIPFYFSRFFMNSPRSSALLYRIFFVLLRTVTSDLISERTFLICLYCVFFPLRFAAYYLKSSLFMYLPPFVLAYSFSFSYIVLSSTCFSTSNFLISIYFYSFFLISIAAYDLKIASLSSTGVFCFNLSSKFMHSFCNFLTSLVNLSNSLYVVIGSCKRSSILCRRSLLSLSSLPRISLLSSLFFLVSFLRFSSILSGPRF